MLLKAHSPEADPPSHDLRSITSYLQVLGQLLEGFCEDHPSNDYLAGLRGVSRPATTAP